MKRNNPLWGLQNYIWHHFPVYRYYLSKKADKKYLNMLKMMKQYGLYQMNPQSQCVTKEWLENMIEEYETRS